MERERHARAKDAFLAALDLAPNAREAWLCSTCADDADVRSEALRLLGAHSDAASPLTRAARALSAADPGRVPREGERIGGYRVVRLLGRGGMGVVLLAEQDNPRRWVALKVLRSELASPERLARFALEARALARLDHPVIARIHEAGEFDTGVGAQPFLAMEYVDGVVLTERARDLSLEDRLQLVARLCDGAQHAHQRGILHRDLKPSNVLVDASGEPRILDFGVCRLVDDDATRPTTLAESLVGTIAYMSPEQLSGDALAVDARSDVYQLGLIAHELATGRPTRDQAGASTIEALRRAREEPPEPLSARDPALAGDLECIVAKALREDPEERYGSAAEFAADLRRFLAHEPVAARPRSAFYVMRMLVRRNRALSAALAAFFLSLVGGLVYSTRQTSLARDERNAADEARAVTRESLAETRAALAAQERATAAESAARAQAENEARRVIEQNDWLRSLLVAVDPLRDGREVTVYELLGRGEKELEPRFADAPRVKASLFDAIGSAYLALSQQADAERTKRRAAEIFESELGPLAHETLDAQCDRAEALHGMTRWDEARQLFDQVIAGRTQAFGAEAPSTLQARFLSAVMDAHQGNSEHANAELEDVLAVETRVLGPDDARTLATEHAAFCTLSDLGRFEDAEKCGEVVFEKRSRVLGPEHVDTLCSEHELGLIRLQMGRFAGALELLEHCTPLIVARLGPKDPQSWIALGSLANARRANGARDAALELYAQCETGLTAAWGAEHPETLTVRYNRARCLVELGRAEEAEPIARAVLEGRRKVLGEEHPQTTNARLSLAGILRRLGRTDEAEKVAKAESVTPP